MLIESFTGNNTVHPIRSARIIEIGTALDIERFRAIKLDGSDIVFVYVKTVDAALVNRPIKEQTPISVSTQIGIDEKHFELGVLDAREPCRRFLVSIGPCHIQRFDMLNAFARFRLDSLDIALGKKAMARFDRTAPQ